MTPARKRRLALRLVLPAIVLAATVAGLAAVFIGSGDGQALAGTRSGSGVARESGPAYVSGARQRLAITADSYVAIDAATGRVLVARAEHARRPIASLTKVMTALVVIEQGNLGDDVRVAAEATMVEPNKDYLVAGRRYPRLLLLYSALLGSNNDAAAALAYAGGDGQIGRFYELMTRRAHQLGMADTTYRSASGLNDVSNVSSAYDQVLLGRVALGNPLLAKIVDTKKKRFRDYGKTYVNHNKMLFWSSGTRGIKTGWTTRAGGCLLTAVERDGRMVIAVILGSDDIWGDMPRLVDRAFRQQRAAA